MQKKEWPLSNKMTDCQNDIPSGEMCYFILCLFYTIALLLGLCVLSGKKNNRSLWHLDDDDVVLDLQ